MNQPSRCRDKPQASGARVMTNSISIPEGLTKRHTPTLHSVSPRLSARGGPGLTAINLSATNRAVEAHAHQPERHEGANARLGSLAALTPAGACLTMMLLAVQVRWHCLAADPAVLVMPAGR
jgi:hypothetical protein